MRSLLFLLLLCPWTARAADWPQFLGPDRNGVSAESGWNSDWTARDPAVLWTTEIGIGFSSCAVAGGKVYVSGHRDGKETFFCLDANSGKTLWSHTYPCKLVPNLHEGGPAATAALDGGRAWFTSKEGRLFCFDRNTGDIAWKINLQEEFTVPMPEWGFASSALIDGDHLVIDAGYTVCLNKHDGELVWKSKKYRCGYGSPIRFEQGGKAYYAVLNNDGLLVLDAATGAQAAFSPWVTSFETNSTTPVHLDGHLFISTAYNKGCTLLKFDGTSLAPVYANREMRNHMANSVLYKGHFYGYDRTAHRARRLATVTCLDAMTGEVKWRSEPGALGCGNLSVAGGKLVVISDTGELVLADADPAGWNILGRKKVLNGRCWTMPVLSGGRIYARNAAGTLVCVDVSVNAASK